MLMAEKFLTPTLPIRISVTVDTAGKSALAAGIGVYDAKGINVELYYSYNAYLKKPP